MRRTLLLAGMMVVGTGTADAAAPEVARTVQLIRMGNVPSADPLAARPAIPSGVVHQFGDQPVAVASAADRRSVEIRMMDRFGEQEREQAPLIDADPGAPEGLSFPTSVMAIPAWMTGGPLHPSASQRWTPGCWPMSYRPTGFLSANAEYRRQGYYGMMSQIACEYGIPVGLFDAMIIQESRYRHHVFSSKNAYGLTQLMPGTAAELGVDRYAVDQNLRGGARYLRQQLDRFGQVHLALAAYNAGPGRIRNAMVPRIRQTRLYVDDILRNWSRLSGLAVPGAWPETQASAGGRQDMAPYRMAQVSTF